MDRVIGLELGADNYLPEPFEPRELVARNFTEVIRLHLVQYLDYLQQDIQQDIGNPPSIERDQTLAQRVAVAIYIRGPDIN